jgi:Protein of unknown function (DUF2971)
MTGTEVEAPNSDLSPEIQTAIRLEGIFMPHARKQRDDHHRKESNEVGARFVHYTSAENALSIIRSKRLWMRNATCMSDFREVEHGFDILRNFFSVLETRNTFVTALDLCAPGAAMEALTRFDQWWPNIRSRIFVASLSEHCSKEDRHGRLSMWRAFGNSPARVAIVIRVPKFSGAAVAMNLIFSPVAYLTEEEARDVLNEVVRNIGQNVEFLRSIDRQVLVAMVFNMVLAAVTCLKHEGFSEEQEWRAIYSPLHAPSDLMESSTEVIGGVPQMVYKIPLDATKSPIVAEIDLFTMFDRLILGPTSYPLAMADAFVDALRSAGVADAEHRVFASLIPIRT